MNGGWWEPASGALLVAVDRALAEATRRAGAHLVCRPGCSDCCIGPFAVDRLDAMRLRRGLELLIVRDSGRAAALVARARAALLRRGGTGSYAGEDGEEMHRRSTLRQVRQLSARPVAVLNGVRRVRLRIAVVAGLTVAMVGLGSCTPRPVSDFELVAREEIPQGAAVVYLYRPPSVLGGAGGCNTRLGDEVVGALEPRRYTYRFVAPGKTRFEAAGGWVAFVTVNLEAAGEYFIRQRWHFGPTGFAVRLDHMTRISALPELETCTYVATPALLEGEDDGEGEE